MSDGWYSLPWVIGDEAASDIGRQLRAGVRLVTFGAELVGLKQPCSPLEAPDFDQALERGGEETPSLKLSFNSTRPVSR